MGRLKPREERRAVTVRARLRTDAGWSDVTIANVSSRGMMLRSTVPLEPRTFVEVRKQNVVVVGRIVWSSGLQCGVSTQDRVDIKGLTGNQAAKAAGGQNDRRSHPRPSSQPVRRPSPQDLLERSQRHARVFDFAVIAALAALFGGLAASTAYTAIAQPLGKVSSVWGGGQGR